MASGLPMSIYDTMVVPDAEGWIEVSFVAPAEQFWMALSAEKLGSTSSTTAYIDDITLRKGWVQDRKCPKPGSIFAKKGKYRYGFNGMEREDEISSGDYDFGARIYSSRLGRWFSPDKGKIKPALSLYQYGRNNPIIYIDPDGNDEYLFHANGTWSVTRADGADVFLKQETADGIYRQLKTTEGLEDIWDDVLGNTDLDFLSRMAMNDRAFAQDLRSNILSLEDQFTYDNMAINAWSITALSAVETSIDIASFGANAAKRRGLTTVTGIAKKGKSSIDDLIKYADEVSDEVSKRAKNKIAKKRDKVYRLYKVINRKTGEFQKWGIQLKTK